MIHTSEAARVRRLYWYAFGVRFGAGMLAWVLTNMFELSLMEDAAEYSRRGAEVATAWLSGQQSDWLADAMEGGRQAWFMVVVLACFYCLTGGFEALPVALAGYALLTSYTPVLAYRAGKQMGLRPAEALFAARLVAFSPAFAFWSGALYKEGLILVVLFLIIGHAFRLQQEFRPASVLVLGLSLVALFGLRFYLAAILTVALVAGVALGRRSRTDPDSFSALVRQAIVLVLLVSVFGMLGLGSQLEQFISLDVEQNLAQIDSSRRDLASSNSGYLHDTDVSTLDSAIQFTPIGMAYFLTVPLPWHIGSFRQNLTIFETLFWIAFVYPRVVRGIYRGSRVNPQAVMFLVLAALAVTGFYALFVGNIGTVYRLRVQVWAIGALLAGWGVARPAVTLGAARAVAGPGLAAAPPGPGTVQ